VVGKVLHCLQDSFSPAHTDRIGAQIVRMKHWGPIDRRRVTAGTPDEHGFPADARDCALTNGALSPPALAAAAASHRYLELVIRHSGTGRDEDLQRGELDEFLDTWVAAPN
jgi:hypothetical protein